MFPKITALALGVLAAASLDACNPVIDGEEPEVCITQALQVPGASVPGPQVTVTSSDKLTVPELPEESGQAQLTENVKLTRAQLIATSGSDLGFLSALTINVSSLSQPLMAYQRQSAGHVTTVDLTTNSSDLTSLFTGKDLVFSFSVTGQIPQQPMTMNLKSCFYVKAELGIK